MNKVQDFDYLEKDPETGAVLLAASNKKSDIQIDYLVKKVGELSRQNKQILALLAEIISTLSDEHK